MRWLFLWCVLALVLPAEAQASGERHPFVVTVERLARQINGGYYLDAGTGWASDAPLEPRIGFGSTWRIADHGLSMKLEQRVGIDALRFSTVGSTTYNRRLLVRRSGKSVRYLQVEVGPEVVAIADWPRQKLLLTLGGTIGIGGYLGSKVAGFRPFCQFDAIAEGPVSFGCSLGLQFGFQ